jgi:hypothetical protein
MTEESPTDTAVLALLRRWVQASHGVSDGQLEKLLASSDFMLAEVPQADIPYSKGLILLLFQWTTLPNLRADRRRDLVERTQAILSEWRTP